MDRRARLHRLELDLEEEAREYKRRRLAEEMQKLAEQDASAIFPPQPADLPPDSPPLADDPNDRRAGHP
jgi:hypothetical protein